MDTMFSFAVAWATQRTTSHPFNFKAGSSTAASFSPLLSLLLFAILFKTLLSLTRAVLYRRRAAALGCGNVPAYPHKDPIIGLDVLPEMVHAVKTHRLLELYRDRFAKYGNTYYYLGFGRWIIMTCEPENIKTILATKMDDWPIAGPRLYAVLPILGPSSVFTTNGPAWHEARAMMRPSFVRDQVADLKCFNRHITNMINSIPTDGSTFDMQKLLLAMTIDSSTDFMLGYSTNTLVNPSPDAEKFLQDWEYGSRESSQRARLGPLSMYLPHRELDEAVQRARQYIRFYLQKAIADKKTGAKADRGYVFLDELLKAGQPEDHTIDQILSIIVAGRDTTAAALTAIFYYLARNPQTVEKLRREIDDQDAAGNDEMMPTWEQPKGMKYLNNVIKEGLRLFPPVPTNSRESNKDTILPCGGGPDGKQPILVPKGTPVRWSLHQMQRRKDIFGPDAEDFCPERWERGLRVGWENIPFHGGPRICLGQQFALTQMSYALYKFFKAFKSVEARDDGPMLIKTNLTACFAGGCLIGAVPMEG